MENTSLQGGTGFDNYFKISFISNKLYSCIMYSYKLNNSKHFKCTVCVVDHIITSLLLQHYIVSDSVVYVLHM